jgi:hypothetical protein
MILLPVLIGLALWIGDATQNMIARLEIDSKQRHEELLAEIQFQQKKREDERNYPYSSTGDY